MVIVDVALDVDVVDVGGVGDVDVVRDHNETSKHPTVINVPLIFGSLRGLWGSVGFVLTPRGELQQHGSFSIVRHIGVLWSLCTWGRWWPTRFGPLRRIVVVCVPISKKFYCQKFDPPDAIPGP